MSIPLKPTCSWITVNRNCNLRCPWCYVKGTGYSPNKDMSLHLAKKLADMTREFGIKKITLIGGEPIIWPHLLDFNSYCLSNAIETRLVTNAVRFGDHQFWDKYQTVPNTSAGISIKAHNRESLRLVSRKTSFSHTQNGIKRAINFFRCGVSTVYNAVFQDELLDIARFSFDCGAKSFTVSFCTPIFVDGVANAPLATHPHDVVKKILTLYEKLHDITMGHLVFSMKLPLCIWPANFISMLQARGQLSTGCQLQERSGLIFDTFGNVIACNDLFDYPLGLYGQDFTDFDGLANVLSSPKTEECYDKITAYPLVSCMKCEQYNICTGGCPLMWLYYDPSTIMPFNI